MELQELVNKYYEQFGDLPPVPVTYSMAEIADLIEDAIIAKRPISQDEIFERIKKNGEPVDIDTGR